MTLVTLAICIVATGLIVFTLPPCRSSIGKPMKATGEPASSPCSVSTPASSTLAHEVFVGSFVEFRLKDRHQIGDAARAIGMLKN